MDLYGGTQTDEPSLVQLEHIRDEMRDCLVFFLPRQTERTALWLQLQTAQDIQSLWFLRSDLMHILSNYCGEETARRLMNQITALFRGYLPSAQFASARRQYIASL
jgi:hypothetical protein